MGPQFENAKAISTLRSGKILNDPYKAKDLGSSSGQEAHVESDSEEEEPVNVQEKKKPERGEKKMDKGKAKIDEEGPQVYVPKTHFLDALKSKAQKKKPVQQEELVELFK